MTLYVLFDHVTGEARIVKQDTYSSAAPVKITWMSGWQRP